MGLVGEAGFSALAHAGFQERYHVSPQSYQIITPPKISREAAPRQSRPRLCSWKIPCFHTLLVCRFDQVACIGVMAAADSQVQTLRKIITSEQEPLARRFRALFSLKYLASLQPPTEQTVPAIEAIAAAFSSPSALLKHELAYCLGQSRHDAAVAPLRHVLQDKQEDTMCRHEAAEALGALGDKGSLALLKDLRDDAQEPDVIRETCDIAVDRIEWEHGLQSKQENLKKR